MTIALIETVRIRDGQAPLWGLHLRRLVRSCRSLDIPFPTRFDVPAGGPDRVHRLQVSNAGMEVSEREVGSSEPVHLVTSSTVHQPYPHKTTERAQFEQAAAEARAAGADDGLLLTASGHVAETSIWSIFWWEGERLCAPPLALGILRGVARERIGELVPIEERRLPRAGLDGQEIFVANAVRGIVEVAMLDRVPVPRSGRTEMLERRFWA